MKKPKQLQLFKADLRFFGGRLLHGKRRSLRPLSSKETIHLVMRSSWAQGANSFLAKRNKNEIQRLIKVTAKKYFVRVYRMALVRNHFHLIIKISDRRTYKAFVRVLSSTIASHVMKKQSFKVFKKLVLDTEKGNALNGVTELQGLEQQFWQFRPWTRVIYWGRDYKSCCDYLLQNTLEALGFIDYTPRSDRYSKWITATLGSESG